MCAKKSFINFNAAKSALRISRRAEKDRNQKAKIHIYLCKECGWFHVGHSNRMRDYGRSNRRW